MALSAQVGYIMPWRVLKFVEDTGDGEGVQDYCEDARARRPWDEGVADS